MPYIEEWEWDEANLMELSAHGISIETVLDVWLHEPKFRRNKRRRAATHQMIGPDEGGKTWVLCIRQTERPGIWRAITGWNADDFEIEWWRKS